MDAFAAPARKYWGWFLFSASILFLASIIFSIFMFLSLSAERASDVIVSDKFSEINLSGFEEAVEAMRDRESDFNKAFSEPLFGDPSL